MQCFCLVFALVFVPSTATVVLMQPAIALTVKTVQMALTAHEVAELVNDVRNVFEADTFSETVLEGLDANLEAIQANHDAIMELKETVLYLNFAREIHSPTTIVFRAIHDFVKSPTNFTELSLKQSCQNHPPKDVLIKFSLMLQDNTSLLLELAKNRWFQSSESTNLVKKVRKTFQEAVWNHGFCLSIHGVSANETVADVQDLVLKIEELISNQEKHIKKSFFTAGVPSFVETFFSFQPECGKNETKCHQEMAENLQEALAENFNYGSSFSVRVGKSLCLVGKANEKSILTGNFRNLSVIVLKSNPSNSVVFAPKGIQDSLDSYKELFGFGNSLCSANFWDPSKTLKNTLPVIQQYCKNHSFCAVCESDKTSFWANKGNLVFKNFDFCKLFPGITTVFGQENVESEDLEDEKSNDWQNVQNLLESWKKSRRILQTRSTIPATTANLREDPELKAFAAEILDQVKTDVETSLAIEKNASDLFLESQQLVKMSETAAWTSTALAHKFLLIFPLFLLFFIF